MSFAWTDKMQNVGASPDLEQATRDAVTKAVAWLSELQTEDERPRFDGGRYLVAKNEAAHAMEEHITSHLDASIVGVRRATIVTCAVTIALQACKGGRRGDEAWTAVVEKLTKKTR